MVIETVRFGTLEIDESRIMTFRDGLLGFSGHKRFALIETGPEAVFYWLQSVDDPALAFVVCDPRVFIPDYVVPIRSDDLRSLEMRDVDDAQVFVIVNKVDGYLTGNLLGPLVVGMSSLQGRQWILSDKRWSTRQRLAAAPVRAAVPLTA